MQRSCKFRIVSSYKTINSADESLLKGESEPSRKEIQFDNVHVLKHSNGVTGTYLIDHNIKVAIKYIPYGTKQAQLQGYKKDLEVCSILSRQPSANTINIYKIQEIKKDNVPEKVLIIMEKGMASLDSIERGKKQIKIDTKIKYIGDIAKGLLHLHNCGIVHRDLKAENVIITFDNFAKVFDFGASKYYGELQQGNLVYQMEFNDDKQFKIMNTLGSIGTQIFNPPQILLGGIPTKVIGSPDMWQFGLLIFQFIWKNTEANSRYCFKDCQQSFQDNPNTTKKMQMPKFKRLNFQHQQSLIDLVQRCLIYHPDQRITSKQFVRQFFQKFDKSDNLAFVNRQSTQQQLVSSVQYESPKNISQSRMRKEILKNFTNKCIKQLQSLKNKQKLQQVFAKLISQSQTNLNISKQKGKLFVEKLYQLLPKVN